jgi:hypothetical protein
VKDKNKEDNVHIRLAVVNPTPPICVCVPLSRLNAGLAELRIPIVGVTRLVALAFVIVHLEFV